MTLSDSAYDDDDYKFPIECNSNLPKPSKANYSPKNLAWLNEFLGQIIGESSISLRYENNTCNSESTADDIIVGHPNDGTYLPDKIKCGPKSVKFKKYNKAAKRSRRLKLFMRTSPANIEYFKDCNS